MRMPFMVRPLVLSALAFSFSLALILSSTQARAQSNAPSSCTTTVIPVNSNDQGNVTPSGVNYFDTVVGSFQDLTTFGLHGFTWSGGTGELYDYPGASQTQLGGVNNLNRAVGTYFNSQGEAFGFFCSPRTVRRCPSRCQAHITHSQVESTIRTQSWDTRKPTPGELTLGSKSREAPTRLFNFPGAVSTYPVAINDSGAVVGWYYDGTTEHGFMEYQNSYATIEPSGSSSSLAKGINNAGEIVGEYRPNVNAEGEGFTYLDGKYKAYVYPSATYTELTGVNALGDRIGDAITGSNGFLTGPGFLLKCR